MVFFERYDTDPFSFKPESESLPRSKYRLATLLHTDQAFKQLIGGRGQWI